MGGVAMFSLQYINIIINNKHSENKNIFLNITKHNIK